MGEFSHQVETSILYRYPQTEKITKDEPESARGRSCSRVNFYSLARINTAGKSLLCVL